MRLVLAGPLSCVRAIIGGGSGILRIALNGGGNDEKFEVSTMGFCLLVP